ncbi:unnamed protein product [Ilex paraguariensis]|uniref:GTP cyclohydrolase 1 n=1 Tax=Ilex paraguariensis TaxID=185542 RepID=A0ABC8T5B9_9AQUA
MFRYVENTKQHDENQDSVIDVEAPVTPEQNHSPVQEHNVAEQSAAMAEESNWTKGYNPPENGEVLPVDKEVPVVKVVDQLQDDSHMLVESSTKIEVPDKSYSSIVMDLKESGLRFSFPALAPHKYPPKSHEQQVNHACPPASAAEVPVSSSDDVDNGKEGKADSFSICIRAMKATPALLENELKKFGPIRSNNIQVNKVCVGFVEFEVASAVQKAIEGEPETLVIKDAVKILLQGLGEDINREGLLKTPLRVAKALREGTRGYKQNVKDIVQGALFPEAGLESGVGHAGGAGGLVIVRDLDFFSYCESCLLPFQVKCHVCYVPSGQQVLGLSKVSRVANVFAKRLQDPQRLADEVCSALQHGIMPTGVAVILQCLHIHFPSFESTCLDSNHLGWVKLLVTSGSGVFKNEKADIWGDFLSLLKLRDINVESTHSRNSADQCWCPSRSFSKTGPANVGMNAAVASILRSLGEDTSRKELVGTPTHFLKWLMNFKNSNLEMKLNGIVHGTIDPFKISGDASDNEEHVHSELNLSFCSQCEHHILPFHGVVHIGYFCAEGVNPIGKSHLQSIVHFYGFKLQVQERLTRQIAETVSLLSGGDVMVVVEANHTCMISRGIEKFGSNTATIAVLGRFSTDPAARALFLERIPNYSSSGG